MDKIGKSMDNIEANIETAYRASRPDSQFIDEIRIVTVPRWKESELSGDEWRISARIDFYRKGVVLGSKEVSNVATAARFLDWYLVNRRGNVDIDKPNTLDDCCDQEGCCKPWTTKLRLKQRYGQDGHILPPSHLNKETIEYRAFCDLHKKRGNCGLDDADLNYEPLEAA